MAKVYKNISIYITDSHFEEFKYAGSTDNLTRFEIEERDELLNMTRDEIISKYGLASQSILEELSNTPYITTSSVLDLPFLPDELEIKFDGNNATEYLANGDFYTQKKKPKPKEIQISCFFPGRESKRQVHRGLNTTKRWNAQQWMQYFFNCMDDQRTINLCFTKWNFEFDCTVNSFNPKITHGEVNDIYYTVNFVASSDPIIGNIANVSAKGHNSWITMGEWQLVDVNTSIPIQSQSVSSTNADSTNSSVNPKSSQPIIDNEISKDSTVYIKRTVDYKNKKYISINPGTIILEKDLYYEESFNLTVLGFRLTSFTMEDCIIYAIENGNSFKVNKIIGKNNLSYAQLSGSYVIDGVSIDLLFYALLDCLTTNQSQKM